MLIDLHYTHDTHASELILSRCHDQPVARTKTGFKLTDGSSAPAKVELIRTVNQFSHTLETNFLDLLQFERKVEALERSCLIFAAYYFRFGTTGDEVLAGYALLIE